MKFDATRWSSVSGKCAAAAANTTGAIRSPGSSSITARASSRARASREVSRWRAVISRVGPTSSTSIDFDTSTATTRSRPWSSTLRLPATCGRAAASAISATAAAARASRTSRQPPQPGVRQHELEPEEDEREHRERHEHLLVGDALELDALGGVELAAHGLEPVIERVVVGGAEELAAGDRGDAAQR